MFNGALVEFMLKPVYVCFISGDQYSGTAYHDYYDQVFCCTILLK